MLRVSMARVFVNTFAKNFHVRRSNPLAQALCGKIPVYLWFSTYLQSKPWNLSTVVKTKN
ncbi:MAG: hypothetical protein VSS75_019375 [Candidatus Parabeggiatoa sp.]|nr:hypothetical protein [Candidatus Parabeggiatoa sp.]